MTQERATPEVLGAMLRMAREKLIIATRNLEEGFFGDAASRAYYAAFHAVSAVLAERGMAFSSHKQTLGAFNRDFVNTGIFPPDSFRKLQRLIDDRQTGDYDWETQLERGDAERDLADAEFLVNACGDYMKTRTGISL
jgi:uncharacterized protein (UPF0332 family)